MLGLTFQVGLHRLALDVRQVAEVVPRVPLLPALGEPVWLAGTFVYRGQAVPVVDLHHLLGAGECPPHLSSRIILVPDPRGRQELLGLLAAKVADVRDLQPPAESDSRASPGADLGSVLVDGTSLLHLLDLQRLLPQTS
jgi:chemotaxis-related protein WspB